MSFAADGHSTRALEHVDHLICSFEVLSGEGPHALRELLDLEERPVGTSIQHVFHRCVTYVRANNWTFRSSIPGLSRTSRQSSSACTSVRAGRVALSRAERI